MRIVLPDDWNGFAAASGQLERLAALGAVTVYDRPARDRAELLERLAPAEVAVLIRARTRLDAELLAALPHLRLVAVTGTGYAHVDVEAATARGILVCNSPGRSARSVAELAFALLLAAWRHVAKADRAVRRGAWGDPWTTLEGRELAGRTLGVLGLGNIGPLVARIARGFDMRVLAWSANLTPERAAAAGATYAPLDRLLAESDAVSIHLRLSDRTRGLLGRRELALLKPGAVLVNTSRGEIVDEEALVEALRAGRIAAGLDVFREEPLPASHPLTALDNVVLTPHIGSVTQESSRRWMEGAVETVAAYAAGRPIHVVNPAAQARRL
ncbi:MAG TPA: D-2-hydroxyacid dehydrogenase family protein [Thermodesulfobacteriota bacterium]|nr:D-2-hydroxyacid dehydrogenase family protein [Thermodesulfobacteriota bacterium]